MSSCSKFLLRHILLITINFPRVHKAQRDLICNTRENRRRGKRQEGRKKKIFEGMRVMEISQSLAVTCAARYANRITLYTPSRIVIGSCKQGRLSISLLDSLSSVPTVLRQFFFPSMSHRVARNRETLVSRTRD